MEVRKIGHYMSVSCCVMTDSTGVNHCQHPPPPEPSKWQRTRWRMRDWWYQNRPHLHRGPCDTDGWDD